MGQFAVNLLNTPANKIAGGLMQMAVYVELLGYEIRSIRYCTVARRDVRIWLQQKHDAVAGGRQADGHATARHSGGGNTNYGFCLRGHRTPPPA